MLPLNNIVTPNPGASPDHNLGDVLGNLLVNP